MKKRIGHMFAHHIIPYHGIPHRFWVYRNWTEICVAKIAAEKPSIIEVQMFPISTCHSSFQFQIGKRMELDKKRNEKMH